MNSARTLALAAVALSGGTALAQVKQGDPPPELTFIKVWNNGPTSFADFANKVVILSVAHSEWDPCKAEVPRLNELHKKYAARGLLVVGVSDQPEATIQKEFIRGLEVQYPWVKVNNIVKAYRIKFWPTTYCIDAYGVVWAGPDGGIPYDIEIEERLLAIPTAPALPPGEHYDRLRSMWRQGRYAELSGYLDETLAQPDLDAAMRKVLEGQQAALVEKQAQQVERVALLAAGPDYASSTDQLERIEKAWQGRAPAAAARKHLDRFAADKAIKKEFLAGKALQKLMQVDTSNPVKLRKLIKDLGRFRKKYAGSHAAKQADQQRARLTLR